MKDTFRWNDEKSIHINSKGIDMNGKQHVKICWDQQNQTMLKLGFCKPGVVYVIESSGAYKIGMTTNFANRLNTIKVANPNEVNVVYKVESGDPKSMESYLHKMFQDEKIKGEWFSLSNEDIVRIKELDAGFFFILNSNINDDTYFSADA